LSDFLGGRGGRGNKWKIEEVVKEDDVKE